MMSNADPNLMRFAELLLGGEFQDFVTLLSDKDELAFDVFCNKYNAFADESGYYDGMTAEELFPNFARWKDRLDMVDWPGESEDGETAEDVDHMLFKHWKRHLDWDSAAYYGTVDASKLSRGDHPLLLFKSLDNRLKTIGFRLALLDISADCYHFGPMTQDDFGKVDGLEWEHYSVQNIDELCKVHGVGNPLSKIVAFVGIKKTYFEEMYEKLNK